MGSAGFGHQRLSIIDLSSGQQPMVDNESDCMVVFNGEIYNFEDIRNELKNLGHNFLTSSDTEVLLKGYIHWGELVIDKLNGMFAFAIWDNKKKKLFAARDRLGKKPFYYCYRDGCLIFASELKAMLVNPLVKKEIDYGEIYNFFCYNYIPAPGTIFKQVKKLRPGHMLVAEPGHFSIKKYWDVYCELPTEIKKDDEYIDELEALLKDSVRMRMISDVPLGGFLSGGIDSSTVISIMAGLSENPVKTFCIDFEEKGYSEAPFAKMVADKYKTEHHEFTVKSEALKIIQDLAWHFDEPYADSSALPTYYVSKMARENVTVVLSGDGGDELFAGYNHYFSENHLLKYDYIPKWIRENIIGKLGRSLPIDAFGRNTLIGIGDLEEWSDNRVVQIFPPLIDKLLSPDLFSEYHKNHPEIELMEYWPHNHELARLSQMQYSDLKLYLPDDILMKVDKMSMAHSLETRAPLLDYRIVEFAFSIPAEVHVKDGKGKYILRKLAERYLPEELLHRKKQGFAVPRDVWFRGELKDYAYEMLTSDRFKQRGIFQNKTVKAILDKHVAGKRDFSTWIWCMLMLENWFQVFMDEDTKRK